MPVLKTYTAQIGPAPAGGGRRASAEDFGASAGLGSAGKSLQDFGEKVLDQKEQEESRKALITSTELRAKYARELDEAALSGGDTAALKEKMAADFAKIGEDFATKRGSESVAYYAANSELMFDEQANRIEVQRAAANAQLEGNKLLMDASRVLQFDENYLPIAKASVDGFLATYTKLRPEQRAVLAAELKQQLNMSAALGVARVNPERALKELEAGRWDLKPQDRERAREHADQEIRTRRTLKAYEDAQAEKRKRELDDTARDEQFKAIMNGTVSQRTLLDDARLSPQTREHLILFAEQRAKALTTQEKASDPVAVRDLWLRIHAPETDPKRVYTGDAIFEAVTKGQINTVDATRLNAMVANQRDENNQTIGAKISNNLRIIGKAMEANPQFILQPDTIASAQMHYQADVWDKVREYRAAGKNPNDLFNPDNKDFVGSPAFIQNAISRAKSELSANADQNLPVIATQEEYDALAPGTVFRNENNTVITKPGKRLPSPPALPPEREPASDALTPDELGARVPERSPRRLQGPTPELR